MLEKVTVRNEDDVKIYINGFMNRAVGWAVMQPDCGKVVFPAQFVLVAEPSIKLATIQFLH